MLQDSVNLKPCQNWTSVFAKYHRIKSNFQGYMPGSIYIEYSKRVVSHNQQISFTIIAFIIMYLNAGTKIHRKVAALNVVNYIHRMITNQNYL